MTMNKLAINTVGDELEASAEFCRSESVGIEVTQFAYPENLDGDLAAITDRHRKAVKGIAPIVIHGPCFDLIASSVDSEIIAVTKKRHDAAMGVAVAIGASCYVAHTNYNPLIRTGTYRKNWLRRMLNFWLPLADEAGNGDMIICLENLWEPTPDIQAELIATANHPHLRVSFDNGHALLFSDDSSSDWVKRLGSLIAHCHLHDNSGEFDDHKPVGEGKENWPELMAALKQQTPQAILVAESDNLADNRLSLERLRKF